MAKIISQPILMINENKQNSAIKLHVTYQYKSGGVHVVSGGGVLESTVIEVYGINKAGKTLIATCPLNTNTGYTAMEVASSVIVGIPVKDYAYIHYEYTPSADFSKIVSGKDGKGGMQMFAEQREYPDSVDLDYFHTIALLS
jgi:hypothetical protein